MLPKATRSAGGIVLNDAGAIAMVKSANSKSWLFPKGTQEAGETDEQTARREIEEETGLKDLALLADLGEFSRPRASKVIKMFLFRASGSTALAPTLEITDARWVPFTKVAQVLGRPNSDWFLKDREWFAAVSSRVQKAIDIVPKAQN